MTVPTETIEIKYTGSGNNNRTEFPFQFPVLDEDHLVVKVIDLSTSPNTEVRLIKNTHYEVHGTGNTGGGHVKLIDLTAITENPGLTNQFNLLIQRKVPLLQTMDLQNQGGFIAEDHERKFDYLTMIAQQLKAELGRCVKTTAPYGQAADRLLPSIASVVAGLYDDIIDISADYTVTQINNGNLLRVDTSGGDVTITLPDTDDLGADIRFAAIKWTDDQNNVIIQSQATESINNAPSIRIDKEYYSSIVVSDSASDMWVALSSDTPPMKDIILDTFTADSDDQASYTLSYAPGNKNNTRLFINGEYVKKDDYSVSGTTLTLNATLAATIEEDDEVEVFYNRPLPLGVPALDSIGPEHLRANSVGSSELQANSVGSSELQEGSVGSSELQAGSVTTDDLADNSVTLAKLAHGSANKIIGYNGSGVPAEIARSEGESQVVLLVGELSFPDAEFPWTNAIYIKVHIPAGATKAQLRFRLAQMTTPSVPHIRAQGAFSIGTVQSDVASVNSTTFAWMSLPAIDISTLSSWQECHVRVRTNVNFHSCGAKIANVSLRFF